MKYIRLGTTGPAVSAVGLGCMSMSDLYGPADADESAATIRAALDAGITLARHRRFLRHGPQRDADRRRAARRAAGALRLERQVRRASAARTGSFSASIFAPMRSRRRSPIRSSGSARTISTSTVPPGSIRRCRSRTSSARCPTCVKAGYVRYIGLSEVGVDTIRRAHATHPICDLQIEYSLMSRSVEAEILPALRQRGIGLTAYGILSRGLIGGTGKATGGFRSSLAALPGREPQAQSRAGGRAGRDRAREGCDGLAARDSVGGVARRRHRSSSVHAGAHSSPTAWRPWHSR